MRATIKLHYNAENGIDFSRSMPKSLARNKIVSSEPTGIFNPQSLDDVKNGCFCISRTLYLSQTLSNGLLYASPLCWTRRVKKWLTSNKFIIRQCKTGSNLLGY